MNDELRQRICRAVRDTEYLAQWIQRPFNDSTQVKVCGDQQEWPWEPCMFCSVLADAMTNIEAGRPAWLAAPYEVVKRLEYPTEHEAIMAAKDILESTEAMTVVDRHGSTLTVRSRVNG